VSTLFTRIFKKKLSTTYLNKYLQLVGTYDIYIISQRRHNMNKKKEIDKLARLTVLNNFISSKLKEQKELVKSFVQEEDKVLKGIEHKLNVIIRSYKRFDSEAFRKDQPDVYQSYKTKVVSSMELKPIVDAEEESELLTENFPMIQVQLQSSN
tara:strand:+ start:143 stop:601 length:459 start_codon:yes stop_codon:yes gene_type:complete